MFSNGIDGHYDTEITPGDSKSIISTLIYQSSMWQYNVANKSNNRKLISSVIT